jgi:TetR/AcrR family transcriptional repressor of mexJK operon
VKTARSATPLEPRLKAATKALPADEAPRRANAPGRPRDMEKRAAILAASERLFLALGFERSSMDAIAAEAGVSKITVYSHFEDKDSLFREVVKNKCERQLPPEIFVINARAPLRQQLTQIGRAFYGLVMSDDAIALHRLMTAQQEPKLAQLFWEEGPKRAKAMFAEFLRAEVEAGALEIDDFYRAAGHFFCLLKGEPFMRITYGCGEVSESDALAHIDNVVDFFIRAYTPR